MNPSAATPFAPGLNTQGFTAPLSLKHFKLIAFDMDSTLINIECVDEIADAAGRKAEVAAITEAAMRGEIKDYKDSLRQRVALLKGVPESALHAVYQERLRLNPGAQTLVQACQKAGLKTLLVSGGFTFFTNRVRDVLGPHLFALGFCAGPSDCHGRRRQRFAHDGPGWFIGGLPRQTRRAGPGHGVHRRRWLGPLARSGAAHLTPVHTQQPRHHPHPTCAKASAARIGTASSARRDRPALKRS